MASQAGTVKRLLVHLLMATIFLILAAFCVWLLWMTYFKSADRSAALARRAIPRQDIAVEPYHGLDESIRAGAESASWCEQCHEDLPHGKSEQMRGLLNAHSFFAACEVCHIAPAERDRFAYRWLRRGSDTPLDKLEGHAGEYGGTIVPFRIEGGSAKRLDAAPAGAAERTQAYKALMEQRRRESGETTPALKAQMQPLNAEIHKTLSEKPVLCDQCHRQNGLLDFAKLMYPPQRAQQLTFGEGAAVVMQYKEFHLPKLVEEAQAPR